MMVEGNHCVEALRDEVETDVEELTFVQGFGISSRS